MARLRWSGSLAAKKEHQEAVKENPPTYKKKSRRKKGKKNQQNKACPEPPKKTYPYKEYLQSEWWKWKRMEKLKSVNFRCEQCGKENNLQVHHRHYKRLGRERFKDLQALCRTCHEYKHEGVVTCELHLRSINNQK